MDSEEEGGFRSKPKSAVVIGTEGAIAPWDHIAEDCMGLFDPSSITSLIPLWLAVLMADGEDPSKVLSKVADIGIRSSPSIQSKWSSIDHQQVARRESLQITTKEKVDIPIGIACGESVKDAVWS